MKVVFFLTSLNSGGLENYLLRFLKEKHKEFSAITVYCKGGMGGQLEDEYRSLSNVTIIKNQLSFYNPNDYRKLFDFFKLTKFDAVCDFTGNFAGLILRIAKKAGIPKRITFYRGSSNHFSTNLLKEMYNKWMNSLVYKNSTDILSNSKAAFDYFFSQKWRKDSRFEIVHNGINSDSMLLEVDDLRDELNIPQDAFVVGHTGRLNLAKNHETIFKVAERLVRENDNFYFILCGNNVGSSWNQIIKEKGLENRILAFDNRSDIPKFLNTMNCFYFPSLTEGQPNSLIEAMVMGLPIVASNIEPIKETVPVGAHKYLIPPLSVDDAVDKILAIYDSQVKISFQDWAINSYNHKILFQKFYNILKCQ